LLHRKGNAHHQKFAHYVLRTEQGDLQTVESFVVKHFECR